MPPSKSQVKLACLACRSYKTRCDGQLPCANCANNQRQCNYRPSRRGGARRGERYQNAKRQRASATNSAISAPIESPQRDEIFIHDLANIIYPSRPLQDSRDFAMTENPSPAVGNHGTLQSVESSFYIRSYQNEQDLVNAYYIFIHPYLPLLPPPSISSYADNPQKVLLTQLAPDQAFLPFWPSSPFGLALMALLVLLPLQEDLDPMRETQIEVRNSYANIYARAALESVDGFCSGQEQTGAAPVSTPGMDDVPRSAIHPELPSTLDPVLALLLLGVYEYCQNSNRRLMRARIYSALILAMDLSLHICQPTNSEHSIIQARVWWNTMFLVYQSAIFNHSSPIVLMNDCRITTPFPDFHGCQKLWSTSMRAQEALLETGFVAKQMTEGNIKGSHEHTQKRIRELDSFILAVIADLDQPPELSTWEGVDGVAIFNKWLMARFLAHTARIKLHRFRAFGNEPVFLDKFCDLSSINSSLFSDMPLTISPGRFSESNAVFPFTEEESTQICLKAALVLSRTLRAIPWPNTSYSDSSSGPKSFEAAGQLSGPSIFSLNRVRYPRSLPYMACCGMQCCYVLMMLLRKVRASLCSDNMITSRYLLGYTEPGTERQDAERFIEELRHGVKSVCDFMSGNAIFGGVVDMAREVETVYLAHFHE